MRRDFLTGKMSAGTNPDIKLCNYKTYLHTNLQKNSPEETKDNERELLLL